MLDNVPAEVKACPQWIAWQRVWNEKRNKWDKIPTSCHTGHACDVSAPANWTTFEHAKHIATAMASQGFGAGFVLGYGSGIVGADFDNVFDSKGNIAVPNMHDNAGKLDSYTELSQSGLGLHVLMRAEYPHGLRTKGVELYGVGRFFAMTGNVYGNRRIIQPRQYAVEQLAAAIQAERAATAPGVLNWSAADLATDDEIGQRACNAVNGQKFLDLWQGNWQQHVPDPTSQSEADIALINILAFYSDSPSQVRRMFLNSALGQRDKAKRSDYVTNMIARAWDRKPPMVEIPQIPVAEIATNQPLHVNVPLIDDPAVADAYMHEDDIFKIPGGFVRDMADYISAQSMWQMDELSFVTALGVMAGICGRQYQFKGGGLNLYMTLLARTGEGKEAMSLGVSRLFNSIVNPPPDYAVKAGETAQLGFKAAAGFQYSGELTGKGVHRIFADSATLSMVTVWTEFSRQMAKMASPNANEGIEAFQTALLSYYTKSARGAVFGGSKNADKSADIAAIHSPAFSLITEGTPGKFYSSLSDAMITEGLLSRFIIVERIKDSVYNPAYESSIDVPPQTKSNLAWLCQHVLTLKVNNDARIVVGMTPEAENYEFNLMMLMHKRGNATTNEVTASLWKRAHQNLMRIAALVAVGINPYQPTVTVEQIVWAQRIIERQVSAIIAKFRQGETGQVDNLDAEQYSALMNIIQRWQQSPVESFASDQYNAEARQAGVLPARYMQQRCYNLACFKKAKPSTSLAYQNTVKRLMSDGILSTVAVAGRAGNFYKVHL